MDDRQQFEPYLAEIKQIDAEIAAVPVPFQDLAARELEMTLFGDVEGLAALERAAIAERNRRSELRRRKQVLIGEFCRRFRD